MTALVLLSSLCLSLAFSPSAESVAFQLIFRGKALGEVTATKITDGKQKIFTNNTFISTRIIQKIEVQYYTRVVYQEGILQEADVTTTLNGNPYSHTVTKRAGSVYEFFKDEKLKSTLEYPIYYSSIMLLFDEPVGVDKAYSEEGGSFFSLEKDAPFTYQKTNSKGRKTLYQYKNQDLQRVDIDAGIVEFDLIRKP
ncbi:MAG: hypothetical protein IPL49_12355 [Saprospirales bacterium]|nr:hypothetical protein [Saprospirales bacterium]